MWRVAMKMKLRKCIMMFTIALLTVVITPLMHAITARAAANVTVTSSGIADISFTNNYYRKFFRNLPREKLKINVNGFYKIRSYL